MRESTSFVLYSGFGQGRTPGSGYPPSFQLDAGGDDRNKDMTLPLFTYPLQTIPTLQLINNLITGNRVAALSSPSSTTAGSHTISSHTSSRLRLVTSASALHILDNNTFTPIPILTTIHIHVKIDRIIHKISWFSNGLDWKWAWASEPVFWEIVLRRPRSKLHISQQLATNGDKISYWPGPAPFHLEKARVKNFISEQ